MNKDKTIDDLMWVHTIFHTIPWMLMFLIGSVFLYGVICLGIVTWCTVHTYMAHRRGFSDAFKEQGLPSSYYGKKLFLDHHDGYHTEGQFNKKHWNLMVVSHAKGVLVGIIVWVLLSELDLHYDVHAHDTQITIALISSIIVWILAVIIFDRMRLHAKQLIRN